MGLAAYGGPDPEISRKMDDVIRIDSERYRVSPRYTIDGAHSFGQSFSDSLVELFGEPRAREGELSDRFRNIAFEAQVHAEQAAVLPFPLINRLAECGWHFVLC